MALKTPEQVIEAAALMREWAQSELMGDPLPVEKQQWWRRGAEPWMIDHDPIWDWATYNYRIHHVEAD